MHFPIGSYTALITPWDEQGKLDTKSFLALLEKQKQGGVCGVIIGGTTGESPTLSLDEKLTLLKLAQPFRSSFQVWVGMGGFDTALLERSLQALDPSLADVVLSVTPYYNRPSQAGLLAHFEKVAKASSLPVVLYDVPTRTGVRFEPQTLQTLAAHDNIIGLKDATGDLAHAQAVRALVGPDWKLWSGNDESALAHAQAVSGQGCITVAGNVVPKLLAKLWQAHIEGVAQEAEAINHKLEPLYDLLFAEPSPAPAKTLLHQLGVIQHPGVRLPLVSSSQGLQDKLRACYQRLGEGGLR